MSQWRTKPNEDGRSLLSPRGGPAPPTACCNLRPSRFDSANKSPQLCAWSQTGVGACKEQSQVENTSLASRVFGTGQTYSFYIEGQTEET